MLESIFTSKEFFLVILDFVCVMWIFQAASSFPSVIMPLNFLHYVTSLLAS